VPRATFDEFRQRYRELFGEEPPRVWHDEKTVTADRRLVNEAAGHLTVAVARNDAEDMCELLLQDGTVLFRVSAFAGDALAFVARTGAFYVRELPGELTDDERVALAAALVAARILRAGG
jgi:hypothetical protein